MTVYYVTNGSWGTGTGSPLAAAQVDGNFYDVDQRIVGLTANLAIGKRISFVTYTDTDMTFRYTDATTQTIPLPIATMHYVGPWMPSTPYARGDLFTQGSGFYQVPEDHTSAATFDPNATDGTTANNPLYELWMPLFDTLDSLTDVTISGAADGDVLVYAGTTGWINQPVSAPSLALDGLTDVTITAVALGQVLKWNGSQWINGNALTNISLGSPLKGQPLVFDGSAWVNQSVADLPISNLGSVSGTANLNLQANEFIRVQLSGNLSITGFTWPSSSSGQFVRRVIEAKNNGSFTLSWPTTLKWAGGAVPILTASGTDVFVIYTYDGGATIFGNVVGQSYS